MMAVVQYQWYLSLLVYLYRTTGQSVQYFTSVYRESEMNRMKITNADLLTSILNYSGVGEIRK